MNRADTHSVVIIEDDEHIRNYLIEAVNGHEALSLQAAVGTLAEAKEALTTTLPRVVLVDLGLPDGSGIDLIKAFYDPDGATELGNRGQGKSGTVYYIIASMRACR